MAEIGRRLIPLMLLGDGQVGKTSLISRLTGNTFKESQLATVGKESYIYQINMHGYDLKMKIWDTAGQERFKSMSVQAIKASEGVILVYAINNLNSFKSLDTWIVKLNQTTDISKKPIIIIGNKNDLEESERKITYEEGKKYAESKGYHFYEASAKSGEKINEAFNDIFEQLYKNFEDEITGKVPEDQNIKLKKTKSTSSRFRC